MRREITLKIYGRRVRIEFDSALDVLSFQYQHQRRGKPSLVQEFPLSHATNHEAVWDRPSAHFIFVPRKKSPSSSIAFEEKRIDRRTELAPVDNPRRVSGRASGDYVFWDDF